MANKDGFPPHDRFPVFLSEQAEETGQPDIGKAWDRAAISSRILKTSIWAVTVTAIGIAILSVGDPVALVANVTATWVEKPALQPDADPSAPAIQSIAGTQDLPTTTSDAPARDEIAAASEPADQNQTAPADQSQAEIGQPPTEALFKQFQAWAAEEDTRAQVEPVQPAQAAPVQVVQDAPAQVRPTKKHDGPGPCTMREQRSGPSEIIEQGSGKSKMHGSRSRPYRTPEHRSSQCKMPRHRRSCKAWVFVNAASPQSRFATTSDAASVARVSAAISGFDRNRSRISPRSCELLAERRSHIPSVN